VRLFLHHCKCGWHSGFKLCCILWWLLFWPFFTKERRDNYRKMANTLHTWGYIPCPMCMTFGQPVKVKSCNCIAPGVTPEDVEMCESVYEEVDEKESDSVGSALT
jgi:hypothetical protein